jgi:hypothetical protein
MKMELRSRAVDKLYRRRDRIEMPDFQRGEVWTDDKKRLLIDTILKGWHLPKLYFRKIDEYSFECVDGQQRLTAIWEFYDNKLGLSEATAKKYGGRFYKELPDQVTDDIDDFELDVEEIRDADDGALEELFQRLQLGAPLNSPERLNAITGAMHDFVKKISRHAFFAKTIAVNDTRFAHFDIAAKWVFVELRGIQPQLRFPQLESLFKDNRSFSDKSDSARRVISALSYLHRSLPKKCEWLRNRANVLSVCMLAAAVVRQKLDKHSTERFGAFIAAYFQDLAKEVEKGAKSSERELLEYQQAISYGSTGGDSIGKRLSILTRRLATFEPAFAPLLKANAAHSDSSTETAVEGEADAISKLVYAVNEKYAATHGEDLFKLTNASTAALMQLGKLVSNLQGYGSLVDAMYKLIYEGSGGCSRLPSPPPDFSMDVKHLRTGIRHDVDHGGKQKAAAKRKEIGAIFEKYSGKKTPEQCSTEDFAVVQMRLLKAARAMLMGL